MKRFSELTEALSRVAELAGWTMEIQAEVDEFAVGQVSLIQFFPVPGAWDLEANAVECRVPRDAGAVVTGYRMRPVGCGEWSRFKVQPVQYDGKCLITFHSILLRWKS